MKANKILKATGKPCAVLTIKFIITLQTLTQVILLMSDVEFLNENEFEKLRYRMSLLTKAKVLKELKNRFMVYGNEWVHKDYTENAYIVDKYCEDYNYDAKWKEIESWAKDRALTLFPDFK
jgi:hypothetical protein